MKSHLYLQTDPKGKMIFFFGGGGADVPFWAMSGFWNIFSDDTIYSSDTLVLKLHI